MSEASIRREPKTTSGRPRTSEWTRERPQELVIGSNQFVTGSN
ncbi:hypothetical protein HALLA_11260 [Halostagnicola larsenii XH-48]|uniref:Uncharacterized protein n=1 Tax=Halostagnicola larsenii XH-48 TaxID=797299 RepID=W0JUB2_9EURY|nr:hypothetical protein HALLA_11260 [Halostagnicola larsenii XH-48]